MMDHQSGIIFAIPLLLINMFITWIGCLLKKQKMIEFLSVLNPEKIKNKIFLGRIVGRFFIVLGTTGMASAITIALLPHLTGVIVKILIGANIILFAGSVYLVNVKYRHEIFEKIENKE